MLVEESLSDLEPDRGTPLGVLWCGRIGHAHTTPALVPLATQCPCWTLKPASAWGDTP